MNKDDVKYMDADDVQYLDWQWVEEHPVRALDLMLKLHRENAALREDKKRLDSGMIRLRAFSEWGNEWCIHTRLDLRAAIDSARAEEAKP